MKRLFLAICFFCISTSAFAWNYDSRWPTFEVDGVKFAITIQADDPYDNSVILLMDNAGTWVSWGGTPDVTGLMLEDLNDAKIMAHGDLAGFMLFILDDSVRRAKIHSALPIPDQNDKIARAIYALKKLVTVAPGPILTLDPVRPLP